MDILKRNLFFIICGLVAVMGVVLLAVGLRSMARVGNRMDEAGRLLRQLSMSKRDTVNRKAVNDVRGRVSAIQSNYREVVDWAHELNRRPPLVPGVFPEPRGEKKLEFRDAYVAEIDRLLRLLRAGEPPTQREVADMRDKIKNERPRGGDASRGASGEENEGPGNRSGLINDDQARQSPAARAALVKAQAMYCYANLESLHRVRRMYTGGIELPPDVLWDAQRTLWVQQDVIEALTRVNENTARRLKDEGTEPWVGLLPVKDVVSIRVSDYVFEDSEGSTPARPGGDSAAKPPGTIDESFTGYYSTDLYDVLQFTVKLVADARYVPTIIDEICKDRFYTPLRVSYLIEPANISMTDRIYGEAPVVRVVMDFEAYYFGDVYRRLMPDAILEDIGAERPGDEEEGTD